MLVSVHFVSTITFTHASVTYCYVAISHFQENVRPKTFDILIRDYILGEMTITIIKLRKHDCRRERKTYKAKYEGTMHLKATVVLQKKGTYVTVLPLHAVGLYATPHRKASCFSHCGLCYIGIEHSYFVHLLLTTDTLDASQPISDCVCRWGRTVSVSKKKNKKQNLQER